MAQHIQIFLTEIKKSTSYLSWCTQNELLKCTADCVIDKISKQVRDVKYYAVEFDCTPNISKQKQASIIIRHVDIDENKVAKIEESFEGFSAVTETTGQGLAETLTSTLENLGIDLFNCRGQSYDNGSNMIPQMRGIHRGVHALILEKNPDALISDLPMNISKHLFRREPRQKTCKLLTFR